MRRALDRPLLDAMDDAERRAQLSALVRRARYPEAAALVTKDVVPTAPHARLLLPFAEPATARLLAWPILETFEDEECWSYAPRPHYYSNCEDGDDDAQNVGLWVPLEEPADMAREATLTLNGVKVPLLWDAQRARQLCLDLAMRAQQLIEASWPGEPAGLRAINAAHAFARAEIGEEALTEARGELHRRRAMLDKYNVSPRMDHILSVIDYATQAYPHLGDISHAVSGELSRPKRPPLLSPNELQAILVQYYLGRLP